MTVTGVTGKVLIQTSASNSDVQISPHGSGRVDVTNSIIENVSDPTADDHATNRGYVLKFTKFIQLRNAASTDINAAATNNVVAWDTQDHKDDDMFTHSTSTNNSRIEVDEAGEYEVHVTLTYDSGLNNVRYNPSVKLRIDGTTVKPVRSRHGYSRETGGHRESSVTFGPYRIEGGLTATQYIEILVDRGTGSLNTAAVTLNSGESWILMKRVA
jgi:hypothetical protein